MTRRDVNEGDVFRKGFATSALEKGATEGQVPSIGSDGEVEFVAAGGGSEPVTQEKLDSSTGAQSGTLIWGRASGDALLDYSDPEAPTVIEAGTYSLSVYVSLVGNISAGTWMEIDVEMDSDNDDWDIHNTSPVLPGVDSSRSVVGVEITAKIPAGAKLVATLYTDAVTNTSSLLMRGQIAKISGNGGSQALPLSTCYLENNTDTSSNAPVTWDTVYDARGNAIPDIPAEMGLALTEADTSVEAQENGLWSVELMANPYADATAQLSLLMGISGDLTGGPRAIPDLTHDENSLLECCLHSDCDLVVGNSIHVIPQVVVDTPTAPGYKPLRYAVLKLIRLG